MHRSTNSRLSPCLLLLHAGSAHARPLRAASTCETVLRTFQEDLMTPIVEEPIHGGCDDIVLLSRTFQIAARQTDEPLKPTDASRVAEARCVTRTRLQSGRLTYLVDDAVLIVSELVTNAVRHSLGQEVTLTLALRNGFLSVRVHDGTSDHQLMASRPDTFSENGRGLWLVASLAAQRNGSWGISEDGSGVWCDLALETS